MTPAAILALVRDVAIVGALIFIIWWIRNDGANSVKVSDMQAVQKQLADNARKASQYAQEASHAQDQHSQDLKTITALVASHSDQPVFLRFPAYPSAMSGSAPIPSGQSARGRGPYTGPGSDIPPQTAPASAVNVRDAVSQFELKYESALADCRSALASWPR